jgi:hypothetical protein
VYTLPVPRITISRGGSVVVVVSAGAVVEVVVVEVDDVVISVEVVAVVEGGSGEPATSLGVVQAARPAITRTIAILIVGRL